MTKSSRLANATKIEHLTRRKLVSLFALPFLAMSLSSCANMALETKVKELQAQVDQYEAEKQKVATNLKRFDQLDYDAFSKQDWGLFGQIHADDVKVVNTDGSVTNGIQKHTGEMKWFFSYMPDINVPSHPIKVASGDWTCVVGNIEGTFSKPMVLPNGYKIEPTGKKVKMQMVTVARWKEDGRMAEEILFMNNQEFMKQMGLVK